MTTQEKIELLKILTHLTSSDNKASVQEIANKLLIHILTDLGGNYN